jgi:two-component system chemotaxis sensor kinase CheA
VRLPLTLAILDGQLIRVANEVMVLPLVTVIESIPTRRETIQEVAGDLRVYEYQDEFIPVVDLKTEFGLNDKRNASQDIIITIVHAEHSKLALIIDELLIQQQVVIKSLETHYKAIQGIAGATILGSGEVALILDVSGLAKRIQNTLMQSERELEPL